MVIKMVINVLALVCTCLAFISIKPSLPFIALLANFRTRDRKRKRYVRDGGKEGVKKVKTESGSWISSTYKSGRYKKWKTGNRQEGMLGGEEHEEGVVNRKRGVAPSYEYC